MSSATPARAIRLFNTVIPLMLVILTAAVVVHASRSPTEKTPAGLRFPAIPVDACEPVFLIIPPAQKQKLEEWRRKALSDGVLSAEGKEKVQAWFVAAGDTMPAEVRLKGDWTDHIAGEKWSYRVRLKNGSYWRGMNEFSLQSPQTRGFLHEWLFHEFLNHHDLLSTRYFFVTLHVNGEGRGVYAAEEHFRKELFESRKRREGLILKFSEDGYWNQQRESRKRRAHIPGDAFATAEIVAFGEGQVRDDANLLAQYRIAAALVQQLRDSSMAPHSIMDVEKTGKFLACVEMFRAYHGMAWHNLRFYYDPVSSRLELIGFDASPYGGNKFQTAGPIIAAGFDPGSHRLILNLTRDPVIRESYLRWLGVFSAPGYLEKFLSHISPEIKHWEATFRYEFPEYRYPLEQLMENRAGVVKRLDIALHSPIP